MPFTLSHAVLAPPISRLTDNRLPIAALAIGCMVPDLIRLFVNDHSGKTHLWTSLLYPNLIIGLCFCLFWYLLYRPVIYRVAGIQHELNIDSFRSAAGFMTGCIFAVLLGTAMHIIWDGLTHVDFRTFAFHNFLSQSVPLGGRSYPMHRILQIGTSIISLPILLWMCLRYHKTYHQHFPVGQKIKVAGWILISLSLLTGCFSAWDYARYFSADLWQSDLYFFTGKSINEFTQGALSVFSLGCLLFFLLDRNHRLG